MRLDPLASRQIRAHAPPRHAVLQLGLPRRRPQLYAHRLVAGEVPGQRQVIPRRREGGGRDARGLPIARDVESRLSCGELRGERGGGTPPGVRGRAPIQAPDTEHEGVHEPSNVGVIQGRGDGGGADEAGGSAGAELQGEGLDPIGVFRKKFRRVMVSKHSF